MASIQQKKIKRSHFIYEERLALEFYLKGKKLFSQETNTEKLGQILKKSRRTIQRKIRRGLVKHETSSCFTKTEYNADYAQIKAEYEMNAKN